MITNIWFSEIESTVFTTVQYELRTKMDAPFPNLTCTTASQNEQLSVFPTLYLHELPAAEIGQDLSNKGVNAIRCTIEIQVFSNKSEKEVRQILSAAILVMKDLMFNITAFPDPSTIGDISSGVARFSRVIGNGDDIAQSN